MEAAVAGIPLVAKTIAEIPAALRDASSSRPLSGANGHGWLLSIRWAAAIFPSAVLLLQIYG